MTFKMQLTNGTTTIDIKDEACTGAGYYLQGAYTPAINSRNSSGFGDVFLPVNDGFTISVVGYDANDVLEKIATLVTLIDSVQLWFDTDAAAADAVNFIYKPAASASLQYPEDFRALVTGGARVEYSPHIKHFGQWQRTPDVRISFMRGVWLSNERGESGPSKTQPSVIQTLFGTTAYISSPVNTEIAISSLGGGTGDSLTIISAKEIEFFEAESLTLGFDTGTTAIAKASGGSVAKMIPLNLTGQPSKGYHHFQWVTNPLLHQKFMVVGVFRNKGASVNWRVDTVVSIGSLADWSNNAVSGIYQLNSVQIPAGSVNPRIVNLGMFSFDELYSDSVDSWIEFRCYNDGVDGTGASDLEFDCWAIIPMGDDNAGFMSTTGAEKTKYGNDGRVLTHPTGKIYASFTSPAWPDVAAAYVGNARQQSIGDDIYAIHFFVYDAIDGWTHHDSVGNHVTNNLTAYRRIASLTPV